MASIKRRRGSTVWTAHFRDSKGKQYCRSTHVSDKKAAQKVADEYESASRGGQSLRAIAAVLAEMRELAGGTRASVALREYASRWLAEKHPEVKPATYTFYAQVITGFIEHLGEAADHDIALVTKDQLTAYRSSLAASVSSSTVNHHLVALRMLFKSARRDGVVADDPSEFVGAVKVAQAGGQRRAFTLPELQSVLAVADPEWRSMILFGLYTGQRLGDVSRLAWTNVDLDRGEIRLVTEKTGRRIILPLSSALREHIESLPSSDDPSAPIHPRAAATGKTTLSGQFAALLVQAGLRTPEVFSHGGKSSRRRQYALDFHSLRHTTTSFMHMSGVAQATAQAFVGHSSAKIHERYVHSDRESLQRAADLLPTLRPWSSRSPQP